MSEEIEEMRDAKEAVKKDNAELNEKVIVLEQEVFESKTVGLELIKQLKECETELMELKESYLIIERKLVVQQTLEDKIRDLQKRNEMLAKN